MCVNVLALIIESYEVMNHEALNVEVGNRAVLNDKVLNHEVGNRTVFE